MKNYYVMKMGMFNTMEVVYMTNGYDKAINWIANKTKSKDREEVKSLLATFIGVEFEKDKYFIIEPSYKCRKEIKKEMK